MDTDQFKKELKEMVETDFKTVILKFNRWKADFDLKFNKRVDTDIFMNKRLDTF
jgi:hypothetical protein